LTLYLDSSALVKLVQRAAESGALRRFLRRHVDDRRVTSALAPGASLRALDAIHLASALALGSGLVAVVTYDVHLAHAASTLGISVEAPR
jgi:predicted nucleic acid-binding protein